jgi:hypothetical protein
VEEAGMPVSWTAGRAIGGERRQFTVFSAEVADMSILANLRESRYFMRTRPHKVTAFASS